MAKVIEVNNLSIDVPVDSKIGSKTQPIIDISNNPELFNNITNLQWYKYKCKICGNIYTKQFCNKNKEAQSKLLCITCERKSRSESSQYTQSNPKIINSESDFNNTKYGSWIKYTCKKCGKDQIISFRPNRIDRYKHFLCEKCKKEEYSMSKYGTRLPQQNENVKKKGEETQKSRHGGKWYTQTEEYLEYMKEKWNDHNWSEPIIKKHKDIVADHPEWIDQSHESNIRNHNGLHNMQTEEGKRLCMESNLNNHGGIHHTQTPEFKERMRQIFLDNPEKCFFNTDEWLILRNNHWFEWRPKTYFFSTQKFKELYSIYGREWSKLGGYDGSTIRGGLNVFNINGIKFDSKWEFEFYIYCVDHNLNIVRNTDLVLNFKFNDKIHYYHPDFIVNGEIVEIKGEHFFRPDGTMFMPFRKKEWTDEDYKFQCDLYEAKHQCMLQNNVKIIRKNDMIPIEEYIESKYGKKFCDAFKVEKDHTEAKNYIYYNPLIFQYAMINSIRMMTYSNNKGAGITPFDKQYLNRGKYAINKNLGLTPFNIDR